LHQKKFRGILRKRILLIRRVSRGEIQAGPATRQNAASPPSRGSYPC
jgi:hypothetical protein